MNMKTTTCAGFCALVSAGLTSTASGQFLGIEVEEVGEWEGKKIMRMYAAFDSPGWVNYWGGSEQDQFEMELETRACNAPGDGFYQSDKAFYGLMPAPAGGVYDNFQDELDNTTYLTIGVESGYTEDEVGMVFDFTPNFEEPKSLVPGFSNYGGIVSTGDAPNTHTDEDDRVLLAQFVMNPNEWVSGQIWISGTGFNGAVSVGPLPPSYPIEYGDLNQDRCINTSDMLVLLGAWGPCPKGCDADLNDDGSVDVSDLLTLLSNWT